MIAAAFFNVFYHLYNFLTLVKLRGDRNLNYRDSNSDHNTKAHSSRAKISEKNNQNTSQKTAGNGSSEGRASNLSADGEPLQCNRKTFITFCELEKRRASRDWHNNIYVFQIIIKISSGESESLEEAAYLLQKTLRKTIRQSDIFCLWEKDRFLILLHDITDEDINKVKTRIEESFNQSLKKCPELDCWFNHQGRCQERSMPESSESDCKPPLSFSQKIDLEWAFYPLQKDDLNFDYRKKI